MSGAASSASAAGWEPAVDAVDVVGRDPHCTLTTPSSPRRRPLIGLATPGSRVPPAQVARFTSAQLKLFLPTVAEPLSPLRQRLGERVRPVETRYEVTTSTPRYIAFVPPLGAS